MKNNQRPKQTAPVVRTVVNSSNNGSNQSGLGASSTWGGPYWQFNQQDPFAGDDAE